jgi:hypothetical protein
MNKRSAIATAGGVVASFVAGMAAVSSNLGLGSQAATVPTSRPVAERVEPIVKHRRIVVHKTAPAAKGARAQAPRTVVLPAPASATSFAPMSTTSGSHAAGGESEHESERGDD